MYDVQLRIEPCGVDDSLALALIGALSLERMLWVDTEVPRDYHRARPHSSGLPRSKSVRSLSAQNAGQTGERLDPLTLSLEAVW